MFLSIVIPVYNVEAYLSRCLDSLLNQICPADVEIICIDDGSTDRSGRICDDYSQNNYCVRVIHQENKGVGAARNVGVENALGKFIAFVDPDDYVSDKWYNCIKGALESLACDILVFDHCRIEKEKEEHREYEKCSGGVKPEKLLMDLTADIVISNSLWQMVFARKLFDGIAFPEDVKCMEDYAVLHKIVLRAANIFYLHESLYFYCVRNDSLVKAIDWDKSLKCYQIAKERYDWLSSMGHRVSCMGYLVQALGLCRSYGSSDEMLKTERRVNAMGRRIIRQHLFSIIADRECPRQMKLKLILACIGLYNVAIWGKGILKKALRSLR